MDALREQIDQCKLIIDFLSHEIRNPLSAVHMFAKLLQEGAYGDLSPVQAEIVDRLIANAGRIEHMLDDFVNMSLLDQGARLVHPEKLILYQDIVEPAIAMLEKKLLLGSDALKSFKSESSPNCTVTADRRLMAIVFDNLFFNAIKYGRPSGDIHYGCKDEGNGSLLWIRNEGQGVKEENLTVIFEKFVRLKDPTVPQQKGTGLGLYNVRRIIEHHGGRIWAESVYGKSFTVFFTLPRQ